MGTCTWISPTSARLRVLQAGNAARPLWGLRDILPGGPSRRTRPTAPPQGSGLTAEGAGKAQRPVLVQEERGVLKALVAAAAGAGLLGSPGAFGVCQG